MFSLLAYADTTDDFFFKISEKIVNPAIEFAFIIAFVVFMYGVMEFIRGAANEQKRTEGKKHMFWGLIGFIIMFGVFGIINLLTATFGIGGVTVNNKEQKVELPGNKDSFGLQELKFPK